MVVGVAVVDGSREPFMLGLSPVLFELLLGDVGGVYPGAVLSYQGARRTVDATGDFQNIIAGLQGCSRSKDAVGAHLCVEQRFRRQFRTPAYVDGHPKSHSEERKAPCRSFGGRFLSPCRCSIFILMQPTSRIDEHHGAGDERGRRRGQEDDDAGHAMGHADPAQGDMVEGLLVEGGILQRRSGCVGSD